MNRLKKYLTNNEKVRVYVIDATEMVQEVRDLHGLSNVATAALGRSLMATTMMCAMSKGEGERVTTTIKGDGPIGSIAVCGNGKLEMKAYCQNPKVELPKNAYGKLDVAGAIGKGKLNIVKDIGLKDPVSGSCELFTSEVAEDYAYYFYTSEQTPSVVALGVLIGEDNKVAKAAGYIIQPLPECEEEVLITLESINKSIQSVSYLMLDLDNLDDVCKTITGDNNIKELEEKNPVLKCDCSRERIEQAVITLGKEEAIKHAEEFNGMEIGCQFCNKKYNLTKQEVEELF